jgi:hypothetical protein
LDIHIFSTTRTSRSGRILLASWDSVGIRNTLVISLIQEEVIVATRTLVSRGVVLGTIVDIRRSNAFSSILFEEVLTLITRFALILFLFVPFAIELCSPGTNGIGRIVIMVILARFANIIVFFHFLATCILGVHQTLITVRGISIAITIVLLQIITLITHLTLITCGYNRRTVLGSSLHTFILSIFEMTFLTSITIVLISVSLAPSDSPFQTLLGVHIEKELGLAFETSWSERFFAVGVSGQCHANGLIWIPRYGKSGCESVTISTSIELTI